MTFQFITNDIGARERRLIRSHVMIGKNAGRPRPSRQEKRDAATEQTTSRHVGTYKKHMTVATKQTFELFRPALFDRLVCNDLAFTEIAHQSAESIELLRQCKTTIHRDITQTGH
jgi:hypothetical protein